MASIGYNTDMRLRNFFSDIYVDISIITLVFAYIAYNWEGSTSEIVGVLIAVASLSLWLKARFDLGESFSRKPEARALVTKGLYAKIRNPMYVFGSLIILGLLVALNNVYLYPFFLLLLLVQTVRDNKEEKVLLARFGKEYLDYKKRTWF